MNQQLFLAGHAWNPRTSGRSQLENDGLPTATSLREALRNLTLPRETRERTPRNETTGARSVRRQRLLIQLSASVEHKLLPVRSHPDPDLEPFPDQTNEVGQIPTRLRNRPRQSIRVPRLCDRSNVTKPPVDLFVECSDTVRSRINVDRQPKNFLGRRIFRPRL